VSVLTRIIYGPETPVGVPYTPRKRWRCYLGLHRVSEVWEFTRIGEVEDIELDRRGLRVAVRLDRPPDYRECVWCKEMG
jgi:hypothetical protein